MLILTRGQVKQLRWMLRAALLDEHPKGQWPLLHFSSESSELIVRSQKGDVTQWDLKGPKSTGEVVFRSSILSEIEGKGDIPVTFEEVKTGMGQASWKENDIPRSVTFDTVKPDSLPAFPTCPDKWTSIDPCFLDALREASLTTAKGHARASLSRILFRGIEGEKIATDGRHLLLQGGFRFPFKEEVLIPSIKLFARKSDWAEEEVSIDKSESHVFLKSGAWTLALQVDQSSRYPDVSKVLPREDCAKSHLIVDEKDAAFLIDALPKLPGKDSDLSPITLDLQSLPMVRARGSDKSTVTEIELARSSITGSTMAVCMDRAYLLRALKLGFREIHLCDSSTPLWCKEEARMYLWMPVERSLVISASDSATHITTANSRIPITTTQRKRRRKPMTVPSRNGHREEPARADSPLDDLICEAEELRRTHQECGAGLSRLISALKQQRKQARVLRQAVASIKDLNLGG